MPITIEQIKELMEKATPGKWKPYYCSYSGEWGNTSGCGINGKRWDHSYEECHHPVERGDLEFIAALPEIAQLCLDQAEEIERLKLTIRGKTFSN